MRLTLNNISSEIEKRTGIKCMMLKGNGYYYFVNPSHYPNLLDYAQETSVYTKGLWTHSLEDWVDAFKNLIKGVDLPKGSVVDPDGIIRFGKKNENTF